MVGRGPHDSLSLSLGFRVLGSGLLASDLGSRKLARILQAM